MLYRCEYASRTRQLFVSLRGSTPAALPYHKLRLKQRLSAAGCAARRRLGASGLSRCALCSRCWLGGGVCAACSGQRLGTSCLESFVKLYNCSNATRLACPFCQVFVVSGVWRFHVWLGSGLVPAGCRFSALRAE
ncbi:hypothetical protein NDU88_007285 [Pleurodeles waltl]|uniref:Uncharacterized protein n=1 Tax=Pleurodeles waltl TaxID=8319 RepID=A0AAV7SS13_PLEWA|nr:hypothetical protein NDU88_007285 [Pleurodeles waltl]